MITLKINGEGRSFEAPSDMPLLWVLRDVLGITGTKFGCGIAQCGACTVHIDGKPVRSCLLPVGAVGNRSITTIEGVGATATGAKVQKAWLDLEVIHRPNLPQPCSMRAGALGFFTLTQCADRLVWSLERCAVRYCRPKKFFARSSVQAGPAIMSASIRFRLKSPTRCATMILLTHSDSRVHPRAAVWVPHGCPCVQ